MYNPCWCAYEIGVWKDQEVASPIEEYLLFYPTAVFQSPAGDLPPWAIRGHAMHNH